VQASDSLRQPLVIFSQSAEARGPRKGAFNNPAFGKQHEAAPGFFELDDAEFDAVTARLLNCVVAAVALINVSDLDALPGCFLQFPAQGFNLCAVIFISRCDFEREQMTRVPFGRMSTAT